MEGIGVFKAIAMAKPFIYEQEEVEVDFTKDFTTDIQEEILKYEKALNETIQQLEILKNKTLETVGKEETKIFDAHLMMVQDPMLLNTIKKYLNEGFKAEASVEKARQEIEIVFNTIPDPYIQARIVDVNDVVKRLIQNIKGITVVDLSQIEEDVILITKDLAPSDTANMSSNIKGIITEIGSETSHSAIMSKARGIPSIVGLKNAIDKYRDSNFIILDAIQNKVIANPTSEEEALYKEKMKVINDEKDKLKRLKKKKAITKDHMRIQVFANIGSDLELPYIEENGAEGIGLVRTEFIYMNVSDFPSEEDQFEIYKKIAQKGGEEIIIRTLDIGGDKKLEYLKLEKEMNPFLGYRAIRLCLDKKDIFKTQLRAILRASDYGPIKIMYPMIASLEELRQAKEITNTCKKELDIEGMSYNKEIQIGIMIEIPSAVMIADHLIKEADFFSIGTNDLCQYTLAVDRMNEKISYLYQPLHPGVLRMIYEAAKAAKNEGKSIGICGEMAGDPMNTEVLVGLGINELSMSASSIPRIKDKILSIDYEEARKFAEQVLLCQSTDDVKELIKKRSQVYDH